MDRKELQTRTALTEFRAMKRDADGAPIIEGRFISFTGSYQICPWATEKVSPDVEIEGEDIRALVDHETRLVLGRTTVGTLKIERKADGVYGTIEINPNDQDAMNLYARVERGDVSQCSFGCYITKEETEFLEDGNVEYTITGIELLEVSVVTFPAYEDTGVSARAAEAKDLMKRQIEAWKDVQRHRLKKSERN